MGKACDYNSNDEICVVRYVLVISNIVTSAKDKCMTTQLMSFFPSEKGSARLHAILIIFK